MGNPAPAFPPYIAEDYGKALDEFYKKNPKASKNPTEWGDKRAEYEDQINDIYGPTRRGNGKNNNNMKNRYEQIKKAPDPVILDDEQLIQINIPPLLKLPPPN